MTTLQARYLTIGSVICYEGEWTWVIGLAEADGHRTLRLGPHYHGRNGDWKEVMHHSHGRDRVWVVPVDTEIETLAD